MLARPGDSNGATLFLLVHGGVDKKRNRSRASEEPFDHCLPLETYTREEPMNKLIEVVGNIVAGLGVLTCLGSGLARLGQYWNVVGFQTMILFNVGVGLMVLGCLAKLHLLTSK